MMLDIKEREVSSMRSVERTFHVLAVLEETGCALNVTDLGHACQLSNATVMRILAILEKYGFVEKRQGRYRLGAATLPLAHSFVLGNELTRVSLPVLRELAETTGEMASLFVRLGFKRILVQRVYGLQPLRFLLPIGQRDPLPVGAGKVLAAAMSDEDLRKNMDEIGEIQLADGRRLTWESLIVDIERIRQQGYSVSYSDRSVGTFSVSAPVIDASGATIAAVSVAGSADKLKPKRLKQLSVDVRVAAKAVADRYDGRFV